MNVVLLKSQTLVVRELQKALDSREDIRLISIDVPVIPNEGVVNNLFEKLKPYMPALFFSINNAGLDKLGKFQNIIEHSNSILVNWYHDYPFFDNEFLDRVTIPSKNRVDFVSEKNYVELLNAKGYNAYFMPLAVDTEFFNMDKKIEYQRDISFVGNSTLTLMDTIIDDTISKDIEKNGQLFKKLKDEYGKDFKFDVRSALVDLRKNWQSNIMSNPQKFIFAMEWMIGYQYRRDAIVKISDNFKDRLTIYGDPYWNNFITESEVSSKACYYDNLSDYYRSSRVNININRIQISTSFTQRHFDTKASGAFLLTEKREQNSNFFITDGDKQEICEFESIEECIDLIKYYLIHDSEREEIALNGVDRIIKEHSYDRRLDQMLNVIKRVYSV